jgi:DNA invertase Pin-like site-specific DNA recombinase
MADVSKRDFKAVLMYEQSRFSREDVFDCMAHWKILKDLGVTLVTVQRGAMRFDDLGGLITAIVGQHEARSESMRLAHRCISGKQRKVRTGTHVSAAPFGFEREILDDSGNVVRRVKPGEQFRRPASWQSRLVPSEDPAVLAGVRYMFEALTQGLTTRQIAIELNKRNLTTSRGKPFQRSVLRTMLRNPVYTGALHYGKSERGKFARVEELIIVPNAHPALVSPLLFEEVQSILAATDQKHGGPTVPGKYPLTGVMFCGNCGRKMSGYSTADVRRYRCDVSETDCCQPIPTVAADAIEGLILRLILEHVLNEENRDKLDAAVDRLRVVNEMAASPQVSQMDDLRAKIARAEGNLALAEDEANFKVIAARLSGWREQLQKLQATQQTRRKAGPKSDGLQLLRDNLQANPLMLAIAIKKTIQRVTVSRQALPRVFGTDLDVRAVQGTIEFHPDVFAHSFQYSDADLYPEQHLRALAEYVNRMGRKVTSEELARALGLPKDVALNRAKRCVRLGLLTFSRWKNLYFFLPVK